MSTARTFSRRVERGFTLVETAIVLVIIGLIVGGIVVGQDLVAASELNSVITDRNRYNTAINTFRSKYLALPGDLSNATRFFGATGTCPNGTNPGTCDGNGDGSVPFVSWTANSGNEMFRVWQHLSLAHMVPGIFTGISAHATDVAKSAAPGVNLPTSRLSGFYVYYLHTGNNPNAAPSHWLMFYSQPPNVGALNPEEAASIDRKTDDGRPGLGKVQTDVANGFPNCVTTNNPDTALYAVTNVSFTSCGLWFNLE